jgi:hypothetical protein
MTDNGPNAAKNTVAAKRVENTRKEPQERSKEMHRSIIARVIRLVIAAVIAATCLGAASVMVETSPVAVAAPSQPTPWT